MIITRMFSKKEKENKSKALVNSSIVAASGTGSAFLGKHLLDKKAEQLYKKEVDLAVEEMEKIKEDALKEFERDVSGRRKANLAALKSNKKYLKERGISDDRIKAAQERLEEKLDKSLNEHIKKQEFIHKNITDKATKDYLEKSKELLNEKSKQLQKNKKIRNTALIGAGLAAAGTYGFLKHEENKKKKGAEKQFSEKEKENKSKAEKALQGAAITSGAATLVGLGKMAKDRLVLSGEHKTKESMDKAIEVAKKEAKELKKLSPRYIKNLTNVAEKSGNKERILEAMETLNKKAGLEAKANNSAHKYIKSSKAAKIGVGATAGLAIAASGAKYLRRRKDNDTKKD